MKKRLRQILHDFYYILTFPWGKKLAMTCKQVIEMLDLREKSLGRMGSFRLWLHLRICQACNSYFKTSKTLRILLQNMIKNSDKSVDIENLNKELLERHAKNADI